MRSIYFPFTVDGVTQAAAYVAQLVKSNVVFEITQTLDTITVRATGGY